MSVDWNIRFLDLAVYISQWSKDPSTKIGCVVVGPDKEIRSTGFNGFPRGIADDGRLDNREEKYPRICHAEENAIMHAARIGMAMKGCILYCSHPPCIRCARSIIQAGIREVCFYDSPFGGAAFAEYQQSIDLMLEARITIMKYPIEKKGASE